LEHKAAHHPLALFYLPLAEQVAPEALEALVVLAQVMQHCVGTLLRLVEQEEQHLLEPQGAAVEAHLMVTAVQEGLAPAPPLMLLVAAVSVALVAPSLAVPLKAAAVVVDCLMAVMEALVVVAEAALLLLAENRISPLLALMEVAGQAPVVGAQLI
jgi:hypothetical protein